MQFPDRNLCFFFRTEVTGGDRFELCQFAFGIVFEYLVVHLAGALFHMFLDDFLRSSGRFVHFDKRVHTETGIAVEQGTFGTYLQHHSLIDVFVFMAVSPTKERSYWAVNNTLSMGFALSTSLMLYTRILNWACTAPHASKRTADNRIRFITLIVLECLSAANVADGKPPGRVKLLLKYYGGVIPGYPNPFLYLL